MGGRKVDQSVRLIGNRDFLVRNLLVLSFTISADEEVPFKAGVLVNLARAQSKEVENIRYLPHLVKFGAFDFLEELFNLLGSIVPFLTLIISLKR